MKIISTLFLIFLFTHNLFGQSNTVKAEVHFLFLYGKTKIAYERTICDKHAIDFQWEAGYLWILEDYGDFFSHSSYRMGYKYYPNYSSKDLSAGSSIGFFALFGNSRKNVSSTLYEYLYRDYGLGVEYIKPISISKNGAFTMEFGINITGLIKGLYSKTDDLIDDEGNIYGETNLLDPIQYIYSIRILPVWGFAYRF